MATIEHRFLDLLNGNARGVRTYAVSWHRGSNPQLRILNDKLEALAFAEVLVRSGWMIHLWEM